MPQHEQTGDGEPVPVEDLLAPEQQDDPDVQRWMAQWMELQQWIFPQRFFRAHALATALLDALGRPQHDAEPPGGSSVRG